MGLPDQAQALEGQEGPDGGDFGQFAGDEFGVTAGGDDRETADVEFAFELEDQFADQAAIAVNRSDEHGLPGALADGPGDVADADAGQEGGFLVEVIGHGREARGDNASHIIGGRIYDIEGDRSAKIDDYRRGAEGVFGGDSVGEAVGTDGPGFGVIEADAAHGFGRELEARQMPTLFCRAAEERGNGGHDAAKGGCVQPCAPGKGRNPVFGGSALPGGRRKVGVSEDARRIGQSEVGVGVADIQEQEHGGFIYRV